MIQFQHLQLLNLTDIRLSTERFHYQSNYKDQW